MRLIDADALYNGSMKKEYFGFVEHDNHGKESFAYSCAMQRLVEAPTIDAIPVAYLMKYAQLPTEFAIAAWRKQDKDAQKKQIKRLDKPMSFDDALNLVNEVFPLGRKEQEER